MGIAIKFRLHKVVVGHRHSYYYISTQASNGDNIYRRKREPNALILALASKSGCKNVISHPGTQHRWSFDLKKDQEKAVQTALFTPLNSNQDKAEVLQSWWQKLPSFYPDRDDSGGAVRVRLSLRKKIEHRAIPKEGLVLHDTGWDQQFRAKETFGLNSHCLEVDIFRLHCSFSPWLSLSLFPHKD